MRLPKIGLIRRRSEPAVTWAPTQSSGSASDEQTEPAGLQPPQSAVPSQEPPVLMKDPIEVAWAAIEAEQGHSWAKSAMRIMWGIEKTYGKYRDQLWLDYEQSWRLDRYQEDMFEREKQLRRFCGDDPALYELTVRRAVSRWDPAEHLFISNGKTRAPQVRPDDARGDGRRDPVHRFPALLVTIGRRRPFAIAAMVVLSTSFAACGGAIATASTGTFDFGHGWTECGVTNKATTFTPSETIYYTGRPSREIPAGETVVWAVTYPDGTTDTNEEVFGSLDPCIRASIPPGCYPGHYVHELLWRGEVVARGEWDCAL